MAYYSPIGGALMMPDSARPAGWASLTHPACYRGPPVAPSMLGSSMAATTSIASPMTHGVHAASVPHGRMAASSVAQARALDAADGVIDGQYHGNKVYSS